MRGSFVTILVVAAALAPLALAQSSQPPVASFKASALGFLVSTDSSASSQGSGGQIVSRSWNWGDGAVSSGRFGTHQYKADGEYAIRLTVTDGANGSSSAVQQISLATFGVVVRELVIEVDASPVAGADQATLSWDFGDEGTATGARASHAYETDGDYDVKLTLETSDQRAEVTRLVVAKAARDPVASVPTQTIPTPEITSVPGFGLVVLLAALLTVARLRRA